LLGYRTTVGLREGLQSMIDWVRARGTKPFRHHLPLEIDTSLVPPSWRADPDVEPALPTGPA